MGLKDLKISKFLTNLYDLINNETYNNDIHWNKDGTSFIIKNFHNFCYNIMPKIFGLHIFSSFHHQLNCYGFVTINTHEYYNKYFTKNNRKLLRNIKRKKRKRIDSNIYLSIRSIENKLNNINNRRKIIEQKLFFLQKRQEYLINESNFLRQKLFDAQTKQKDLGYIFFTMVENLYPEFSFIKKQCLYFINSNNISLINIENKDFNNNNININNNSFLKEYNFYKIDSGISLCNTQDTKTQEEYDNFIDVE
jgi:hypothetical protein